MKMKSFLIALLSAFALNVNAGRDANKTVNTIGVQNFGMYYFSVKEGLSTNCLFGVIYVPMNDFGKGAYSLLLIAKSSDKKISFDYSQNAEGACGLEKIDLL